jgi:nucleoside-diphosphate-sugar epimerase
MDEVLVIGGAGFLGSHLVRMLRKNGTSVRVFSRSAGKGQRPERGIRYVAGAISDAQGISDAVRGVKVVYDLAANPVGTWEELRRAYVDGARNVAEACLQHGVQRLVYASTTATLDWGLTKTIDETAGTDKNAHLRPGFYHLFKIAAETLLCDLHAKSGLPVVIIRPAIIVGRGGMLCHSGIGAWRDDICCTIVGKGRHPLAFVLVQDVVTAFFAAMNAPDVVGRTFNLAGDVRPSALDMVHYMRERSRRDFRAYPQNLYKLYAISWLKYMIKAAVGKKGDRPNRHTLKCEQVRTQLDCSAAKKYLGWKPVSDLETFLQEAVDPHLRPIHPQDLRLTG